MKICEGQFRLALERAGYHKLRAALYALTEQNEESVKELELSKPYVLDAENALAAMARGEP